VHLCSPPHKRPHKFFQGWTKTTFCSGYPFQVAFGATQIDVHKTLYPFCATKKMSDATAIVANSVPSKKIYTEQIFVFFSMNILILKFELAEF